MRRLSLILFALYALWSIVAVLEIVLRHRYGRSPLPGVLADHNGNIAVSGFIIAAAFPGAFLARLGERRASRTLRILAAACVPIAAVCWGTFFIAMEFLPLYGPNYADWSDVPGSVFGLVCGAVFGWQVQRHLADPGPRRRRPAEAAEGSRRPAAAQRSRASSRTNRGK